MSNITTGLIATLKDNTTGVGVYLDEIPETADVPAIALYNVSYANDRVQSGKKTKNTSTWRLTVVDTVQNLQNTIDQILLIDNTSNDVFQRLFFELTLIEPKALSEPHKRAFIEIRAYPK